ncbi:hypothetical protein M3Y98_00761300 [Aphelenchoides besseyi]|nr:hypothetical protein M3Y98_00761300 [Aphelenchoides besseyi]
MCTGNNGRLISCDFEFPSRRVQTSLVSVSHNIAQVSIGVAIYKNRLQVSEVIFTFLSFDLQISSPFCLVEMFWSDKKGKAQKNNNDEKPNEAKRTEDVKKPKPWEVRTLPENSIICTNNFKYLVKNQLGKGGCGTVYKVERMSDKQAMVVKVEWTDGKETTRLTAC